MRWKRRLHKIWIRRLRCCVFPHRWVRRKKKIKAIPPGVSEESDTFYALAQPIYFEEYYEKCICCGKKRLSEEES